MAVIRRARNLALILPVIPESHSSIPEPGTLAVRNVREESLDSSAQPIRL